jgi:Cu(I)/Ag(I) efflux system membrane fusion protein
MEKRTVDGATPGTRVKIIALAALICVAFALGYFLSSGKGIPTTDTPVRKSQESSALQGTTGDSPEVAKKQDQWTCSMHPQIRLPNPGKCPICYMDLIPLETADDDHSHAASSTFTMSDAAKTLAQVQSAEVKRERAKVLVRMLGMVVEDETREAALTSRVDGRLDEIYVNFTGVQVTKGDPMVKIWSPTLIKNQVELFETMRQGEPPESVIKGAEERLIQSGLTREQIEEIKEKKKPILYVTLRAPISGTVMKKNAVLGQFVKEGTEMYIVNDLSHVWIRLDAYETDIPWIRYGQDVTFTVPAFPGRKFSGKVLFIDPILDTKTRTVKVRVEAPNPDNELKPGMFVTAELESEINQSGKVMKQEWAGKYICPVHPKDEASPKPGTCPESNMALRPATSYGYADQAETVPPLVVPASAPLITGKRAIVYVEVPGKDRPTYEPREVVLGPRAGDKYVVYQGLNEGERVVGKGAFKIDSAMQILARPSMMSPPQTPGSRSPSEKQEELVKRLKAPPDFVASLTPLVSEYLALKEALVEEDGSLAEKSAKKFLDLMAEVPEAKLDGTSSGKWKKLSQDLKNGANDILMTGEIQDRRRAFDQISEAFVRILMTFRHGFKHDLFVFFSPTAFNDQGAYWIEVDENSRNPYFGSTPHKGQDMLTSGELVERIPPDILEPESPRSPTDKAKKSPHPTESHP